MLWATATTRRGGEQRCCEQWSQASEVTMGNSNNKGDMCEGAVGNGNDKGEASEGAMTRGRQAKSPWAMAMTNGRHCGQWKQ